MSSFHPCFRLFVSVSVFWIKWWRKKEFSILFSAINCSLSLSSFFPFVAHTNFFIRNNLVFYHHRSVQGINWRLSALICTLKHFYWTFHSRFAISHLKKGKIKNGCETLTPFVICIPQHKHKRIQLSAS